MNPIDNLKKSLDYRNYAGDCQTDDMVHAILDLASRLDDYKQALDACTDWISRRDKEMFEKEMKPLCPHCDEPIPLYLTGNEEALIKKTILKMTAERWEIEGYGSKMWAILRDLIREAKQQPHGKERG